MKTSLIVLVGSITTLLCTTLNTNLTAREKHGTTQQKNVYKKSRRKVKLKKRRETKRSYMLDRVYRGPRHLNRLGISYPDPLSRHW